MLTLEMLKQMPARTIFAEGITSNSPDQVYMTDSYVHRKLKWAAIRGDFHDWAIYCHWEDEGWSNYMITTRGSKVPLRFVHLLVEADASALKYYRP